MTPVILLDNLEGFVKEKTKDIKLQVRVRKPEQEKERAADVYKMRLPKKEDQTEKVPYILLQFLTGKDGEVQEGNTCQIRIAYQERIAESRDYRGIFCAGKAA